MKSKPTWLEGILLLAPFIALAIFWRTLPARVPVHWNLHNQVNAWASKDFGLFLLPLLIIGVVALLHLLPRLDPKLRESAGEKSRMPAVLPTLGVTLAAFGDALFCMQLLAALGHGVPVSRIALNACLFLFAVLGNYSATLRPNYFIGIRTPWTLESPETWRATHRLAGRLMFFGSLVLFVLQFFLSDALFTVFFIGLVLAWAVWAFWYSWHYFQALQSAAH